VLINLLIKPDDGSIFYQRVVLRIVFHGIRDGFHIDRYGFLHQEINAKSNINQ
jgi:hypothetical protein